MRFQTVTGAGLPTSAVNCAYLLRDPWDDWFSFDTRFRLIVYDSAGARHIIGPLKIGQAGLASSREQKQTTPPSRSPALPAEFERLGDEFFSLGQEDDYYESLNELGEDLREEILHALRDCARDLSIFQKFAAETVMGTSLLRYLTVENVRNRLNRLAGGNVELTPYHFEFELPTPEGVPVAKMSFEVKPTSEPPTNVHVLIGRNGVGKSRCIQSLTATVLGLEQSEDQPRGKLVKLGPEANNWSFSGLVHVCYSAFDSFSFPAMKDQKGVLGTYVGLSDIALAAASEGSAPLKDRLAKQFVDSFKECRSGLRAKRWRSAIANLCTDPMFDDADVANLLDCDEDSWQGSAAKLFRRLSSGHSIVLLTTTRLVELVDERTLVILDEPEGHLHPPLLSAFVRAVSNLLVERNGVAIIATHSPVVLQEVPAECVSVLTRNGLESEISPPSSETFGESVGVLTREVFGLEVTNAGFHALIGKQVEAGKSFEQVLSHFDGKLGSEAQLMVRGLVAARKASQGQSS